MYRPYSGSLADQRPFMDVESQIRGLTQDYVTSFNTGNYDQIGALFTPEGVIMAPHMESAYGPKAVEKLARQMSDAGYESLRAETLRVEHSGDMAMEIGRYSMAIRQADGTTKADRGKYVKVWRRLGAWMIVADCWNSNLALLAKAS
ncbi:MAG TPA: nuclear transport factor 2 family protein [Candidatus Sulfotelmatobacter sp.]|nr:nuclear transport factor 2 family protein [Candidatus Sulfotelmatobacter sp.]